jgi:hypothetical protein
MKEDMPVLFVLNLLGTYKIADILFGGKMLNNMMLNDTE